MENIALQTLGRSERRTEPKDVRRVQFLWGVFLATTVAATAAQAVELTNRDRTAHEITINHSDGRSETIKVGAGQRIANICSDCVVLAETTSVEVKGDATVKIERGEVSIDGKR
jgi:hypothetical protein